MKFLKERLKSLRKKKEVHHHAFGAQPASPGKKRVVAITAVGIVIVLAMVLIVQPAFTGYTVYQEIKDSGTPVESYSTELVRLQSDLTATKESLATCQVTENALKSDVEVYQQEATTAKNELQTQTSTLSAQLDKFKSQNQQLLNDLEDKDERIDELEDNQNTLIHTSAEQFCCVNQIFDSEIDSYDVDDKIVCQQDGDGEFNLNC